MNITREPAYRFSMQPIIKGLLNGSGSHAHGILLNAPDKNGRAKIAVLHECNRCGGMGGSDKWKHTGWTCFDCDGTGRGKTREEKAYTKEAFEKLSAMREKRAERKRIIDEQKRIERESEDARMREERFENYKKLQPEVVARLPVIINELSSESDRHFLKSLLEQLNRRGELSDGQSFNAMAVFVAHDEEKRKKAASRFLGAVGESIEIHCTTKKLIKLEGRFGTNHMVIMETPEGQQIKYVGSSNEIKYSIGARNHIKAKVKMHETYDGLCQTAIERPKSLA